MNDDASLSPLITAIRGDIAAYRAARRARARLRRDLAEYHTDADRLELAAILDRHRAEDAAEIRSLLV